MNVSAAGGSQYMQANTLQRGFPAGGVNARQMAENDTARKTLPLQAAENAARAMTEAKGMFVDTYA